MMGLVPLKEREEIAECSLPAVDLKRPLPAIQEESSHEELNLPVP